MEHLHPLASKRPRISCFSLSSTITVKSLSKGMKHIAALILRWLKPICFRRELLRVCLQAICVETLFSFLFLLCRRVFESLWAGEGKTEAGCCKDGWGGGSSVFILCLKYSLCICMLHCIENRKQSLGERSELASPASQVNSLIARPHITAQVGSITSGRSKSMDLNSFEQLRSHKPDILCYQVLVRENRKKKSVLNVVMLPFS